MPVLNHLLPNLLMLPNRNQRLYQLKKRKKIWARIKPKRVQSKMLKPTTMKRWKKKVITDLKMLLWPKRQT